MFFGGISGSAVADVSALGTFLIPQMVRKGYDLDFATALTVSTAVMAPIIPPSIIAVIYAWMADKSVAAMFAAGVIPGLLVGIGMAVPIFVIAKKRNYPEGAAADAAAIHRERSRPRAAGTGDPGDHHGRHPVRPVHADRSRSGHGGLRARGAADLLPRARAARTAGDLCGLRAPLRRDWADHRLRRRVRLGADLFEIPVRGRGPPSPPSHPNGGCSSCW